MAAQRRPTTPSRINTASAANFAESAGPFREMSPASDRMCGSEQGHVGPEKQNPLYGSVYSG